MTKHCKSQHPANQSSNRPKRPQTKRARESERQTNYNNQKNKATAVPRTDATSRTQRQTTRANPAFIPMLGRSGSPLRRPGQNDGHQYLQGICPSFAFSVLSQSLPGRKRLVWRDFQLSNCRQDLAALHGTPSGGANTISPSTCKQVSTSLTTTTNPALTWTSTTEAEIKTYFQ